MSAPDQPDARDALTRLEEELTNIQGMANCLMLIGKSRYNETAFGYLGGQLHDHHAAAREAFDELHEAMKTKAAKSEATS